MHRDNIFYIYKHPQYRESCNNILGFRSIFQFDDRVRKPKKKSALVPVLTTSLTASLFNGIYDSATLF